MARERPTPTTGGHSHCLVCGAHLTEKSLTPAVNCYHGNTGKTLKARLEAALDIHLSPQDFHSEEICQSCEDILTDLEEYCQRRQNFTTTFWKTAERFQKQVKVSLSLSVYSYFSRTYSIFLLYFCSAGQY